MSGMHSLLTRAGFPSFLLDDEGFPNPGPLIRYYREKMKYKDPLDRKEKCWTQADLAKRLGLSEVTIRLMETQNVGLDSITRRRLVADVLKIPPILLGIGSLNDLAEFLKNHEERATSTSPVSSLTTIKSVYVEKETVSLYKDAATVYWGMHSTGTAQDAISEIEQWIGRVKGDVTKASEQQKRQMQDTLWSFHTLAARIYSDDLSDWNNAFGNINTAMELAVLLDNQELRAATLYRSAQMRLDQRNFLLAKADLDGAMVYAQHARPLLKSAILADAGLAHALVDRDEAGKTYAQSLFDQAGAIVSSAGNEDDVHFTRFNVGKFYLVYADALITLNRPRKALQILDDAAEGIDSSQRRRHAYINILQAEASMHLKQPRFDIATDLLMNAFSVSEAIKSEYNIGYIARLYIELRDGPYGNSKEVADLGVAIRRWRKTQATLRVV